MLADTQEILVRASSLSGWPDCPRRGAARIFASLVRAMGFVLRETPSGVGAAIGTSVHRGAETALSEKARSGRLPPVDVATDAAVETLRESGRRGIAWDKDTTNLNDAEKQAARMTRAYALQVAPQVEPILVEQRLEATLTWTSSRIVLSGQADVIAREPGRVRDLKTGKMRSNHRPQIGAYGLLSRSNGLDVSEAAEDFVQRAAPAKPQPDPVTYCHDLAGSEQAAVAILKSIDQCLDVFLNGDEARRILPGDPWAFPANPSSKLCSERWCAAWGTAFCSEWDSGTAEAATPRPVPVPDEALAPRPRPAAAITTTAATITTATKPGRTVADDDLPLFP